MLKRTLALILALVVLASMSVGCGTATPSATAAPATEATAAGTTAAATEATTAAAEPVAVAGGTMNINIGNEPPELDPQITTDTVSFMILNMTIEGLVRYDQEGGYAPGVAKEWTVSEDGLTYTFTLRDDAKWSNGEAVTAADFEYGIKRALNPETASQYGYILYDIKNAQAAVEGTVALDEIGVKADSATQLTITLERPTPYFLSIMAFGTALPCNQKFFESAEAYGAEADQLIYNGPYTISEWTHESQLVMTKNENYWNKDAIALDEIKGYMIVDNAAAKVKFFNKELDMIGVVGTDFQEFIDKGYELADYSDGSTFYLEFNTTDKLMSNKKIRQAFSYALDRTSYINNVRKDHSSPALALVPPILPGKTASFREEVGNLIKDNAPDEAKKLLEEGLAEVGVSLADAKISLIMDEGDVQKTQGAAVQDMWKKNLGIDVTVEQMPFKSRIQKMTDKDFQMVFAGWGPDYNDPMTFLDMFLTGNGNNHTSYSSEAYDKLINDAKVELDASKRMDLLYAAEKLLMEDMPIAPVYYRMRTWTTNGDVDGIVRRAIGGDPDLYWATKK